MFAPPNRNSLSLPMNLLSASAAIPIAALLCALLGAAFDVRSRRIPNLLTGPAILVALMLHLVDGGWRGLASSFLALLVCGTAFLVIYLAGGMGAGDVKFIAAQGCFLGLASAGPLLVLTALCGGVLAVAMVIRHGRIQQTAANVAVLASHHLREGVTPHPELNVLNAGALRLPYALAIAAGTVLTVWLHTRGTV